jgi:plastocyanin
VRRRLFLLIATAAAAGAAAAALAPAGQGVGETLIGTVGPGFTISLTLNGQAVTHLDPGTYTVQVDDKTTEHNFHLFGPGVDEFTSPDEVTQKTWTVTFKDGTYNYVCDVHLSTMKGKFTVGDVPTATPPAKLFATVGPGKTISLGTAAGKKTAKVAAGKYVVTVKDKSKTDSFHLSGPGVNKKTAKAFVGTASWAVTLKAASTYKYWSDARPSLKGTLKTS